MEILEMLAGVAAYVQCAGCFQCRWAPIFYQLWWIEVAMGWMSTLASYPLILRSLACVTNLFFSELWHCRAEWGRRRQRGRWVVEGGGEDGGGSGSGRIAQALRLQWWICGMTRDIPPRPTIFWIDLTCPLYFTISVQYILIVQHRHVVS